MEARYYVSRSELRVECQLCPHTCIIADGMRGICHVRKNIKGVLYAETYGQISAMAIDPIEKKPLYHFHPGKNIFSIGSFGCNFHCNCCQNSSIAQAGVNNSSPYINTIDEMVEKAQHTNNNIGIAFTYNEPIVWFEYMFDIAKAAKLKRLKTVMVSNGFISTQPLHDILPYIDAFNIDLKTYDEKSFQQYFGGKSGHVLSTIEQIISHQKHLELTYLLIPELNDKQANFETFIRSLKQNFGSNLILHISKYFPRYKSETAATSDKVLFEFADLAAKYLNFVYVGNVIEKSYKNTHCLFCNNTLIRRYGYDIDKTGINIDELCNNCMRSVVEYIKL